jgi:hypothetical protein
MKAPEPAEAAGARAPGAAASAADAPPRWLLTALLALQLVWGAVYVLRTGFLVGGESVFCLWDDAMISMRYARNLAEGHGLVWNPGERVQGFSNPGVTLLMAGLHLAPLGPARLSLLLQLVELGLAAASLALVWRIARRLLPDQPLAAPAAALATLACAPVQIWALQGSDTGFVGAWLLGCLALVAAGADRRRPALLAIALGLGAAIRLDATVFALAVIAASLRRPGARLRRLCLSVAPLALVWAALLGLGWLYYGDPLPNTYYLKASGSPRALVLRSGLDQLLGRLPGLAPALAAAAASAIRRRDDPRVLALAAAVLAGFAYDVWAGGDWVVDHGSRFSVPALPPLLILAADGLLAALGALGRRLPAPARGAVALAAAAALGLAASPAAARVEWLVPSAPTMYRAKNFENFAYGTYFARWTHPETTIGLHWAGVPAYFSGRPAVDLLGRSDRHIARLAVSGFAPGHSKWDWDYTIHTRRPDLILEASRGLDERPDFRSLYFEARSAEGLVFFVRRKATAKLLDERIELFDLPARRPVVREPRSSSRGARGRRGCADPRGRATRRAPGARGRAPAPPARATSARTAPARRRARRRARARPRRPRGRPGRPAPARAGGRCRTRRPRWAEARGCARRTGAPRTRRPAAPAARRARTRRAPWA